MTAALLLILESLTLITLAADLSRDFGLLGGVGRTALILLAFLGALLLPAARRGRPLIPRLRAPIAALATGSLFLGALGTLQSLKTREVAAGWEEGARARLETRARILDEDAAWFLDEMLRPVRAARLSTPSQEAAFETLAGCLAQSRLPRDRQGFSLYRADGTLLAWQGNSEPVPADLLIGTAPGPIFRIGNDEASQRLYALLRSPKDGLLWVSEFLLKPSGDGEPPDDRASILEFLPRAAETGPAHVHLRQPGATPDDLDRLFERQADRYWGRAGREGVATLSFPLRSPAGDALAVVTLKDHPAEQTIAATRNRLRRIGAFGAAFSLLAACYFVLRRRPRGVSALLAGTAGLWSARWSLLALGTGGNLSQTKVFDLGLYASPGLGGLLRSPADFFLTTFVLLAQVALLHGFLTALPPPVQVPRRARVRRLALGACVPLGLGGLLGLHHLLDTIVGMARLDLSRVEWDGAAAPRLLLQLSLFLLVTAGVLLIGTFFRVALRCRDNERSWRIPNAVLAAFTRLPLLWRAIAGVLLLTLLYVPFLHHAYDRLRQTFFEETLLPRVLRQQEWRAQALRNAMTLASSEEFATAAAFAAEGRGENSGVAYRLWTRTPMAEMGLASSLQIYESEGRLLDRFAVNLAPGLEVPFATAIDAAGGDLVQVPPRPRAIVRKPVLFGSRFIRAPRRAPLLVVMTIVDDYDNLPGIGADTSYVERFRARALTRTNPELLRSEPMLAVFGPTLDRLYESGGEVPPPGARQRAALEGDGFVWSTDIAGEGPARILYARGRDVVYALAQPHASVTEFVADSLRLFLLNLVLATFILAAWRFGQGRARGANPVPRFYRRLTAFVLLTALLPLIALALFITRFNAAEFASDVTTTGLASLQVARRVAQDYLTVSSPEESPTLDDDAVFWLSRVVRQDLNIYKGADLLATSTRELFSSGILNTRLEGSIYKALYLDREPYRQAVEHAFDMEDMTLSAPMRIDAEGTLGVISIPLGGRRRALSRKVEEVEDALLISTCVTILLLAGMAYLVAGRVSEPITLLARAARRVAEGDLNVRVTAVARDEVAILVDAFNRMAGSLREQQGDLRRRKEYIETILRSVTTGVVSVDARGSIITINPSAQAFLAGPSGAPAVDDSLPDRLALEGSLDPLRVALSRVLTSGTDQASEVVLPRGGQELRLRAVFLPFVPVEGASSGAILLLEDVTEIIRSGRLAAWADMARRIAHEIKNPLTPIQLSVEHVRRLWRAQDPRFGTVLLECLDNIQRQVRALRTIASEFAAYARLPEIRPEPTPVIEVLDEALNPYESAPPSGVTLRREIAPDLPPILADRPVLARALVNLIENALQAMPGGGTLTVAANAASPADGGRARVRIEVRDTGAGIDPAIRPRLFEPYFSTKSGGTGLGLPIVKRAVEDHGGELEIDSRVGSGTVVRMLLPAVRIVAPGDAS